MSRYQAMKRRDTFGEFADRISYAFLMEGRHTSPFVNEVLDAYNSGFIDDKRRTALLAAVTDRQLLEALA